MNDTSQKKIIVIFVSHKKIFNQKYFNKQKYLLRAIYL